MFTKLRQQYKTDQKKCESGQGLVEYALILIFVGIVIIVIVNVMEEQIANLFSELANDSPVAPPALLAFNAPPTATPHPDVTLTVNTTGSGSVTKSPDQAQYAYGSEVTLQAIADSGWAFIGWEGDLTGQTNPVNVVMDSDKTITAKFANATSNLTITIVPGGSGNVALDPPGGTYAIGQEVTLTGNPLNGWFFKDWSGDFSSTDNPAVLTITGDMAVTATFDDSAFSLTTNAAGDGTGAILRNPDLTAYGDGSDVTLTAVADPGSFFSGWSGDLSGSGNPQTLTMDRDKTVTAVFSLAPAGMHTLTVIPVGNGTVTIDPNQTSFNDGQVVTLTAVADPGWTFTGWSGDLSGSVTPTTLTMNGDKTVTATFTQLAYTLDVTTVGNGTYTLNPDQATYTYGTDVTIDAVPDPDWEFANWSGDLSGSTDPTTITMDGNKSVTVNFSEIPCTLPAPWASRDVGGVATAGKACQDGGVYSVYGSGADIWGSADEFHYMYQTLTGDGEIIARITAQTNTNNWAKTGVMIRESLNPDSKHAFAALTPANGLRMQYRENTGGSSGGIGGGSGSAPIWLKLERTGNVFRAYRSGDGTNWTEYASRTISMRETVYYGIAVTSHSDGDLSTGLATNVAINPINTIKLETITTNVDSNWKTVNLSNSYSEMVVVCSVNYGNNSDPEVVRVRVNSASSYQMRLQNPDNITLAAEPVHCLIMEAGAWTLPDGRKIEAQTYNSTITDNDSSWNGAAQSYLQSYTNPVVLGQVMSDNDADWSVFWNQGSGRRTSPPTASALRIGKHVGQDPNTNRTTETLGFIVIEEGHGTVNGVEYEAALGNDSVRGIGNGPPYTYNFNNNFSSTPQVVIVTQAAMDGGNGSWAYFYGNSPVSTSALALAVDEYDNNNRAHTHEQVGYLVFSGSLVLP